MPTLFEEVAESSRLSERLVGATDSNRVGTHEDGHLSTVTGDRDFLTRGHPVEELRQRSPGFTHGDR